MAVTIKRDGYGQLEPNHLSAPRTGRVFAQLPAASSITSLENGMFAKYDYANKQVNFTGDGPWMLVFCEEKLYDERKQMHKHFHLAVEDSADGKIYPRLFALEAGDIFTTNMVKIADPSAGVSLTVGDWLKVGTDGVLVKETVASGSEPTDGFKVVEETDLPDGQKAVKVQLTK